MSGYACEFQDGPPHSAVWLHTNMETGVSIALCAEHNAPGLIPLVATELGADPMRLYAAVEAHLKREEKQAAKELAAAQAAAQGAQDGPADAGDGESGVDAEDAVFGEPDAAQLAAADKGGDE